MIGLKPSNPLTIAYTSYRYEPAYRLKKGILGIWLHVYWAFPVAWGKPPQAYILGVPGI